MKRLILLVCTAGFLFACKDNKTAKEKSNLEKDDYSKSGKTESTTKTTDETGSKSALTGSDKPSTGGWPQSEKNGFMQSCERSAMKEGSSQSLAESYCQCMMEKMEAAWPDIYEVVKLSKEEVGKFTEKNREDCLGNQ